jgi:hypothetical protein
MTGPRRKRIKLAVVVLVAGGVALFALANAHLVYVAVTSQPECVPHGKAGTPPGGPLQAAKSSC